MAKLKSDINFLKASGAAKKLKVKASMGVLYAVVLIIIVGVLGGMIALNVVKETNLTASIDRITKEINDPNREIILNEYLAKKEVLQALVNKNKGNEEIVKALENKFKVDLSLIDVFSVTAKEVGGVEIISVDFSADQKVLIVGISYNDKPEKALEYLENLAKKINTGAYGLEPGFKLPDNIPTQSMTVQTTIREVA